MTLEEVRAQVEALKVQCGLCSFRGHSLVRHLKEEHKLSPGQYHKKFAEKLVHSSVLGELMRQISRSVPKTMEEAVELYFRGKGSLAVLDELKKLRAAYTVNQADSALIPKENPDYILPDGARMIAFAVERGRNVYIQGPVGCGKTDGVEQVIARMGRPCRRINMNGDVTTANFIGQMQVNAQGTFYSYGILPLAMKGGYPLLCDEVDFVPPQIGAILHSVLEGKKTLFLPDVNETVVAEPGFCVMATANTGGKGDSTGAYTGTEVLNVAMLDRFPLKLNWDYLPESQEITLLSAKAPHLSADEVKKVVNLARDVRVAFKQGNLALTLSTRKLLDYVELRGPFTVREALDLILMNWLDVDDEPLVKAIVQRVGLGY